jgi:hypothetical protein
VSTLILPQPSVELSSLPLVPSIKWSRELKSERAAAARASAKARGRTGGCPRTEISKLENARVLYENSDVSSAHVCSTLASAGGPFLIIWQSIE